MFFGCTTAVQDGYHAPRDGDMITTTPTVLEKVDQMPVMRFLPDPGYPAALRAKGIKGSATISFIVGVDGRATQLSVKQATHPEFGEATLAAISRAVFNPAVLDAKAVPVRMEMPLNFPLQ